ncbi:hypothetical protein K438DRAFT_1953751 [Mycena galopus ATCC 62051]|nr:hypothetical protein K438DRAFT_1953751 [Mycena galopus ATCC 62051]
MTCTLCGRPLALRRDYFLFHSPCALALHINIDAFPSRPVARAKLILGAMLKEAKRPDIFFPQEVTSDVRSSVLENPKVREAFLVTGAEDQTFANMTLMFVEYRQVLSTSGTPLDNEFGPHFSQVLMSSLFHGYSPIIVNWKYPVAIHFQQPSA